MRIDTHHVLLIVIGNLLLAAASSWFLLSAHVISGGMDVPPLILHKYFNLPVSVMVLLCDSFIVLGGLIVYGWMPVLVGLLSVAACSKALSFTLNRSKQ